MLRLTGTKQQLRDGISRRTALRIGALGMGGLSLPGLLAAERSSGVRQSHKSVIMIYMVGAPPHQSLTLYRERAVRA